jgi:hypothetical protein
VPDASGQLSTLGIATMVRPGFSPTHLQDRSAGVEFTAIGVDGYLVRGVQHAVIAVPQGQGATIMAALRAKVGPGTVRIPIGDGWMHVGAFTVDDPPVLGDEAYALREAIWDERPGDGATPPFHGVLYAFRRGDYIALLAHLDGAIPERSRDSVLTDTLAGAADQRLASFVSAPPSTSSEGVTRLRWALITLAVLAAGAAGGALLRRGRLAWPHTPRPA